jgi:hypothetical protein
MESYLHAEVPGRHTVFGVRLKPFCIGHALLLQRQNNPLGLEAIEWSEVGKFDLLEALLICAGTFEESLRWIDSRRGAVWLWWNGRRLMRMSEREFTAGCAYFERYLQLGNSLPGFWEDPRAKAPRRGAPWMVQLKVALMAELHVTETAAMNYPVARAQHNLMTQWERKGCLRLRSREDDHLSRLAAEMSEERGLTNA